MRILESDIKKINLKTFEMEGDDDSQREKVDWENGMVLPPRPIIVGSDENQANDENANTNDDDNNDDDKENKNDENKENEKVEENIDNNENIVNNKDDTNESIIKLDT